MYVVKATNGSGGEPVAQHFRRVRLAQPLERAIAKLTHTLPRHSQLARDLLQRHRPVALETEVQREHAAVARRQYLQRTRNRFATRIALDAARENVFVLAPIEHQRFTQRAAAIAHGRRLVERARRLKQRHEPARHVEREVGDRRDLFLIRFSRQLLTQHFLRAGHARQVGRSIERYLDRAPLLLHRRVQRLANPPHGVADEVHADVRIVLVRGAHETGVRLTDQIAEGDPAVLVLFGDGKSKAQVRANQLGAGTFALAVVLGAAHLAGELLLLLGVEHGLAPQLIDVEIQQVAIVARRVHRSPLAPPGTNNHAVIQLSKRSASRCGLRAAAPLILLWSYARFAAADFRRDGLARTAADSVVSVTSMRRRNSAMYASSTAG